MSLCPVCHSEEPHNRQLCSNSPETIADYLAGLNEAADQGFYALPPSEQRHFMEVEYEQ